MTAPPTGQPATPAAAQRAAIRMTRIEGDLDAHRQMDELRFETLAAAIGKLEVSLAALQLDVREGFERLGAAIQEIQLRLAGRPDDADQRGHWRVGPFGQWALGLGALALLALMGWMGTQLWLEEPARIHAAQTADPLSVTRVR